MDESSLVPMAVWVPFFAINDGRESLCFLLGIFILFSTVANKTWRKRGKPVEWRLGKAASGFEEGTK